MTGWPTRPLTCAWETTASVQSSARLWRLHKGAWWDHPVSVRLLSYSFSDGNSVQLILGGSQWWLAYSLIVILKCFLNKVVLGHSYSFQCILCLAALVLQGQSWVAEIKIVWPTKPNICSLVTLCRKSVAFPNLEQWYAFRPLPTSITKNKFVLFMFLSASFI